MSPESKLFEDGAEDDELEITVESVVFQNDDNGFRVYGEPERGAMTTWLQQWERCQRSTKDRISS